jgi:drug/metabolite transporter (DMT)-like permease
LIRFAQREEMPALTIAAGRLITAALILTPIAWARAGPELRTLERRSILLGMVAGLFLACHFTVWITSLSYTSVASSTVLVTTNPLWVGLASVFILRERMGWRTMSAIVLTLLGSTLITLSDTSSSPHSAPLLGNTLALIGALTVSAYFLLGRTLQRRISTLAYIWLVYTSAAVVLLIVALLTGQHVRGYSPIAYLVILAMALGPQLLGHTALNWSLRYLSATFITIAILGEPIIASIFARILFGEQFTTMTLNGIIIPLQLIGFITILVGIALAAFDDQSGDRQDKEEGSMV